MKKIIKLPLLILIVSFLSGCAVLDALIPKVETPKNANEFRKNFSKKHDSLFKKSYVVKKSHYKITKSWKARAKKCLNKRVRVETKPAGCYFGCNKQVHYNTYLAKVKAGKKKSVLSVQFEQSGEGVGSNAVNPPGGAYFIVMDAIRISKNKTRINEYRWDLPFIKEEIVTKSILNWATGRSRSCPDLSKLHG